MWLFIEISNHIVDHCQLTAVASFWLSSRAYSAYIVVNRFITGTCLSATANQLNFQQMNFNSTALWLAYLSAQLSNTSSLVTFPTLIFELKKYKDDIYAISIVYKFPKTIRNQTLFCRVFHSCVCLLSRNDLLKNELLNNQMRFLSTHAHIFFSCLSLEYYLCIRTWVDSL